MSTSITTIGQTCPIPRRADSRVLSSFYPVSKLEPLHGHLAREVHKIVMVNLMSRISELPEKIVLDASKRIVVNEKKRKNGIPFESSSQDLLCYFYMTLHACSKMAQRNRGVVQHGIDVFKAKNIGFVVNSDHSRIDIELKDIGEDMNNEIMVDNVRDWVEKGGYNFQEGYYKGLQLTIGYM